jgi:tetratricopeptide (TPR) repeat protein
MSLVGTSVGHIRIVGDIGRGGMGEVYIGLDERLQRRVALKAIRAEYRLDPGARARFLREARMLSQLEDPHICRIHDYIEVGGTDFLVLELIEGRTLTSDVIASLDRAARFRIAEQPAAVLMKAHVRGVVHRDLKPGNLMVVGDGSVKVLDFGLARATVSAAGTVEAGGTTAPTAAWFSGDSETGAPLTGDGAPEALLTIQGSISGSALYMSPEQARGEALTTASDMYSFGLVLQELFTGHAPQALGAPAQELIARAARAESLPVTGVDPDLRHLIGRLKQPAPAARPTAVETAERLHWIKEKPRRRVRRLIAAAAIIVLSAGVLKYTLDLRAARGEAEHRRGQAEDLIAFMLGDLRSRLAPVGRLEILDEVGAKALAYFDSLPPEAQNDDELMRRARALSQIGEVRLAKGDADGAIVALGESLTLASRGVERQPSRTDWLATLGATHFWIGYAHWNRNEFDAALREFTAYRTIAGRMVELEPRRTEWRNELAQSETNLGSVHQAQGRFADAERHFDAAVTIKRALLEAEPDNPRWKQELAGSLSWLGESVYHQGRVNDALRHYEATAALLASLTAAQPANTDWRLLRAISHAKVSMVLRHQGRAGEALAEIRQAEELSRSLVAHDPMNADWKRELGVTLVALAWDLIALDRPTDALSHAREAHDLLLPLVAGDSANADWRRVLASADNAVAAAHVAGRNYAAALTAVRRGREVLEPLRDGAADPVAARHQAEGFLIEADALAETSGTRPEQDALMRALASIAPAAERSTRADVQWPYAQVLVRLGRRDEARPILQVLAAQSFRSLHYTRFCARHSCDGERP